METYLTQKFSEIYRDISFKSKEQCLGLVYTYLGRASEGSLKGTKLKTLDNLIARKIKGDQIIGQNYENQGVSIEAKTAMDIIRSIFIQYTQTLEAQIEIWRGKYEPKSTRGLYELSMAYQGREFNGEKSPSLESISSRYKRANKIILKLIRKNLTEEKVRAIKDLAKRFIEYEQTKSSTEKYLPELREKNKETLYTLERFAKHYKIIKEPIRKKQQQETKDTTHKTSILNMPVREAAKKVWNVAKKVLLKKIF